MPEPHAPGGQRTDATFAQFRARAAACTPYQKPAHVPVCHRVCESRDTAPPDPITTLHPRILQQAADAHAAPRADLAGIAETLSAPTSEPHADLYVDAPRRAPRTPNRRAAR